MDHTKLAGRIRCTILKAARSAGKTGAHIAPSLSIVEIMIAILECCKSDDVFILSKGHGGLGYYATMYQMGMISQGQIESFESDGGEFPGQPSRSKENRVSYSSGSLGMGLSYGVGRAYADPNKTVYVLLGDGECNEGAVWEGAALANRLHLSNLIAVVDRNSLQSDGKCADILGMDYEKIWDAYGWNVKVCNGHMVNEIESAMIGRCKDKPTVVVADTVKGKGVSFMEDDNTWHHTVLREERCNLALKEIGEAYGL